MANTDTSIENSGLPNIEMTVEPGTTIYAPCDATLSIAEVPADAKATGDAINAVAADVADIGTDVAGILAWSGEDIPLTSDPASPSIADVIGDITGDAYPVGSIYMTTKTTSPTFNGTWVEIAITATWAQLKTGKRGYEALEEGDTGGTVHFWLRTA